MNVPGSALWHSSFLGFTQPTDWDHNNGGVILFDDGTIWSYECESPVYGDQHEAEWPWGWPAISEWKPSTNVWERLTPNSWGWAEGDYPPGYDDWPCDYYSSQNGYGSWIGSLNTGPLGVAQVGNGSTGYLHVQDPNNHDDVWFYCTDSYDRRLGPIKIDRHTRTWTKYLTTTAGEYLWYNIASNVVIWGEYMWFLTFPAITCSNEGLALIRAEKSNPDNWTVMHTWEKHDHSATVTANIADVPAYLVQDNTIFREPHILAISDDGYAYVSPGISSTTDTATTTEVNRTFYHTFLAGFKIGDYDLEVLYWHGKQDWEGTKANDSYYWATCGIETAPGEFNSDREVEPTGMGFVPIPYYAPSIRDGWLYWQDNSGHWGGAYGTSRLLCRMDLSKLKPATETTPTEPIQHSPQDPLFEVIGNGTDPWEGAAGHLVRYGPWIFWRDGGTPVLPHEDATLTFDDDGNLIYKCMMFPPYYPAGGPWNLPPEYGVRGLLKLGKPEEDTVDVTMTFTGTSLTGYGNVREVPTSQPDLTVRLGRRTEDPDV